MAAGAQCLMDAAALQHLLVVDKAEDCSSLSSRVHHQCALSKRHTLEKLNVPKAIWKEDQHINTNKNCQTEC
jgi:hypothetical protein